MVFHSDGINSLVIMVAVGGGQFRRSSKWFAHFSILSCVPNYVAVSILYRFTDTGSFTS